MYYCILVCGVGVMGTEYNMCNIVNYKLNYILVPEYLGTQIAKDICCRIKICVLAGWAGWRCS